MSQPANIDELFALTSALYDDTASTTQHERLADLLSADPAARQFYCDYADLVTDLRGMQQQSESQQPDVDSSLKDDATAILRDKSPEKATPEKATHGKATHEKASPAGTDPSKMRLSVASRLQAAIHWHRHKARFVAFVLSITLLIWAGFLLPPRENQEQPRHATRTATAPPFVAKVTRSDKPVWADPKASLWKGLRLMAGESVELKSGLVEITFGDGAVVSVEGPAKFQVNGNNSGELLSGKILAWVPRRASGFVVDTVAAQLVDLGTEFVTHVDEKKSTFIYVYQGKVEVGVKDSDGAVAEQRKRMLKGGQSLRIDSSGVSSEGVINEKMFVHLKGFGRSKTYEQWLDYSRRLRADADLLAYYSFEKQSDSNRDRLINQAQTTRGRFDGLFGDGKLAATRPTWARGRWQHKSALRFDAENLQRVIVPDWNLKDSPQGLTVALWARLANDRPSQTLVTQWQGAGKGGSDHLFHLNIRNSFVTLDLTSESRGYGVFKHEEWHGSKTLAAARWQHFAFTLTPHNGPICLYKNGKEVNMDSPASEIANFPTAMTPLVIGGKVDGGSCLSGLIDELVIFRRAISAREIQAMYEAGTP